ncbi:MAG: bifunctional glutamate N-acetyltransferase/amino-acid acetyltransferase ArgJ [Oscillospiraceae bacterium]|nr:bifunctional glutamate N-acetyltransferase/amino-acid acetyltransferase ArgJ [Clostridiaceae bacterium]MDY5934425.1 bifunctional glutamate N-acetyltransferase/amino-acid acetyltransferase ArgJ [Oscillospiraceae bacterium]
MKEIQGGICAAKGFKANGIHCGIRKNKSKRDLSLIVSDVRAAAAAVYTTNLVKGAPILVNQKHLADGYAQAIICNSGIANTCNANGVEMAEEMGKLVEKATGVKSDDVVIASTGVIGMPLNVTPIANGMDELVAGLGYDNNSLAAEGIMTTDTKKKETAVSFEIDGVECRIGGMAKGSGMIHPNMATMLVFVTSDVAITSEMLQKAVSDDVKTSFNMISVDGDTSTNDTFAVLANGMAGNKLIDSEGEAYDAFCEALHKVSVDLSRKIAGDGEGATKLLECKVTGGKTDEIAKKVAKSVICSSLTKAAMFGADANWGRVLCAIGYSGADVDIEKINVSFKSAKGTIEVCRNGAGVDFSEEKAKEILLENEIDILVDLNDGDFDATAWGCDLTYEYVKINGDYRT